MTCLHLLACLLVILQVSASDVEVIPGEDAVLQCQAPSSAKVTVVEWTKDDHSPDDYLFLYRNGRSYEKYQHPSFRGRVELRSSSFADSGDVSVVLKKVSGEDMGTYRCRVLMTSSGGKMEEHSEVVHLMNQIPSGAPQEPERVGTEEGTGPNVPVLAGVLSVALVAVIGGVGFFVHRRNKMRNHQRVLQEIQT
ncbi:myelin-oligodendrocyte glycoprotein-like [Cyprinodon tularosa]|uniref:myelin-oligodendrocyte glycoprotein-like n=1 Tax=Cyprinodon tularosa TaxID=77115 RepID=UPI0018E25616|nr:myelin-oligodendrocyte glycoprotein-like [Cyprinodon tularosa]